MLTTRGGSLLGVGVALIISWVALGEIEMLAAGVGLIVAVVAGLVVTNWSRPLLDVRRRLNPALVHEGDRATVDLMIRNLRRLPAFNLTVSDGVGGLGTARFALGSLSGGDQAGASYRIVCRPRGVYEVGPAVVRITDPLGLAMSENRAGETDQLIVYPATEELTGYPMVRGRDPAQMASRPEHSQRGGEDFYTLRSYHSGDDLRRVHWPSSAKLDDLVIKQMETPWQSRALIFFDVRRGSYADGELFEKAVRGTASVVRHLASGGFAADLWLGTGLIDVRAYSTALEALARVQPVPAIDLRAVATRLRHTGRGGALVLVTGRPDEDLLGVQRLLSAQHRATVLMAAVAQPSPLLQAFRMFGVRTVVAAPQESWAAAWSQSIGSKWAPVSVS
jgi:uncharacterized protein (DUF58 family)